MQPFDYRIAVQDPLQMALAGYQQGQQFQQQRVQGERETQLYDMEMQQYQANQAKLQEEQARAKAMQADFASFTEGLSSGTATIDDVFRLNGLYPEMAEQVQSVYQMKSDVQKNNEIRESLALASLFRNAPDAGAAKLAEKIAAAEAAGDQERLAGLKSIEASIGISPDAPVAATIFTLSNVMEADQFKLVAEQLGLAPEKLPDSYRADLLRAEAAGLVPGTPEHRDFMRQSGGGQNITVNAGGEPTGVAVTENAAREKYGTVIATQVGTLSDNGLQANRNLNILGQLEAELANAPGGVEAGIKLFAGGLGIPSEGINELQAADAIISSLIPKQREEGSGSSSDKDVESFKKSLPSLLQTPEGRRKIIKNLKALNEYAKKEAAIANKWASGEYTIPQYQEALAALGSPLAPSGGGGATTDAALPVINNQASYDALPSGSDYTTGDGITRTKP
jgi:hypothetical protein